MCPHAKSAIIIEICFFTKKKKPQIENVICADVSENRLPETKNNFSVYDISQPTPSVSLSVPSCSLANYHASNGSMMSRHLSVQTKLEIGWHRRETT